jgi:hypothetical protein
LCFGFCEHLDLVDFARESKFLRIGTAAFLDHPLKLIEILRSARILEKFGFNKSSVEMITCESGSTLMRAEERCFYGNSLRSIWTPNQVDFIGESALAANGLELADVCEVNAQFAISWDIFVDWRDAIAFRYLRGGERVIVNKRVRVTGHVWFSKMKFRWLTLHPTRT